MGYDFQRLKEIPIADVLSQYNVLVRKRSETQLVCHCPLPSHRETEHKNKNETFCISIEKNKAFCHSVPCRQIGNHPKGLDVLDIVCRLDCCDVKMAAKKLSQLFGIGNGLTSPPSKPVLEVNKPLAFELKNLDPDHPFIRERGISLETAMEFGVGYFGRKGSMANRILFPINEDGQLVGYAGRTVLLVSDDNPKWLLPKGLHRTYLYGLEKCDTSKPMILCESPWGVLHFYQHGVQAVALIACAMTEAQERRLDPFKEITVAMDDDQAGHEAAEKIISRLKQKHVVRKAFLKE